MYGHLFKSLHFIFIFLTSATMKWMGNRFKTILALFLVFLLAAHGGRLPLGGEVHHQKLKIMPLGDSLSICCHKCSVPSSSITGKGHVEPITPWGGYIRKLWKALASERDLNRTFDFEFVGRVRTCMINSSKETRVRTDDWEVRYEGYYGYSTSRILTEVLHAALNVSDPDIVVVILGTNDLIQARIGNVPGSSGGGGRVQRAVRNLKTIVQRILCVRSESPTEAAACAARLFSRQVVIGTIPPILFSAIRAAPPSAKKPHRVRQLNEAIAAFVSEFNLVEEELATNDKGRSKKRLHTAPDAGDSTGNLASPSRTTRPFLPRLHLVDLSSNFSMQDDLHGDGLHPNDQGEDKISQRIFAKLMASLLRNPEQQIYQVQGGGPRDDTAAGGVIGPRHLEDDHMLVPMLDEMMLHRGGGDGRGGVHALSAFYDSTLIWCVSLTLAAYVAGVCYARRKAARTKLREV